MTLTQLNLVDKSKIWRKKTSNEIDSLEKSKSAQVYCGSNTIVNNWLIWGSKTHFLTSLRMRTKVTRIEKLLVRNVGVTLVSKSTQHCKARLVFSTDYHFILTVTNYSHHYLNIIRIWYSILIYNAILFCQAQFQLAVKCQLNWDLPYIW